MGTLVDYEDSDDSGCSNKMQVFADVPASFTCLTEVKEEPECSSFKLCTEASSSGTSWDPIKSRFVDMGYSSMLVDKAIEKCGILNESAILEYILNYQGSSDSSWVSMKCRFVDMGYSSTIVDKAIEECGVEDETAILDSILTYHALENSSSNGGDFLDESYSSDSEDTIVDDEQNVEDNSQNDEVETRIEDSQPFPIREHLLEMGFTDDEVSLAIERLGIDSPAHILIDSIYAARFSKIANNEEVEDPDDGNQVKKKGLKQHMEEVRRRKFHKRKQSEAASSTMESDLTSSGNKLIHKSASQIQKKILKNKSAQRVSSKAVSLKDKDLTLPSPCHGNRMFGFGIPGHPVGWCQRKLNEFACGAPYFYFENVANTPKGVWDTISRFLYDVEPEFVDSKYFSVSSRKRGYLHNLPIDNRHLILPLPPMTIREAFPETQKYWPSWDYRTKLNCINTVCASSPLCERLRDIVKRSHGKPSLKDQADIIDECKKWNLVWVGPDQLAPLESHEIEVVLGFEIGHTRGASSRTDRLRSLGNAFQTDTVGYHLSVLKPMYPKGINVLSLFSGIGGAEVALHRLGITLKCVVSAELCEKNRLILRSWWQKTKQKGKLIEVGDVQNLTNDKLKELIYELGGFDLIIGGSPCNNLTGSNRCSRDGLEGKHSSVFYEFPRIVNFVRHIMH